MAEQFLNLILALSIVIFVAKASGYLSTRLGQPAVLGELLAGLILGPTVLDMLHVWPVFSHDELLPEVLTMMGELGVIFLMMLAGLELHLSELLSSGKVASLSGVLGVVVPLLLGWGTAALFGVSTSEAIFIGLALSATSVSISAQTLMELGVLRSRVGLGMLGAAVFDDVLVILMLSIATITFGTGGGTVGGILLTVLFMIIYLIVASVFGIRLLPRLLSYVDRLPISQGTLAFTLVTLLLYSWAAEVLGGMASITGAFLVGLFLGRTPYKTKIERGVAALAYGFFVPIFFVNIGLEVDLLAVSGSAIWFALLLVIVAVISKIVGSGVGAIMGGFTMRESIQLGIGMVSRGEVGLIVASFALAEGLLSLANFAIVVFMVIVATLVTPPLLRLSFASPGAPQAPEESVREQVT
ncbi:MAG: cation:proton antiporter [Chloroflexi bacterium]|nr:MAG: cation:proton antiporter [Chloroflexota bacterium]